MQNNIKKSPPHWCRDAIPSVRGWCDAKTGELLIAVKGIELEVKEPVEVEIRKAEFNIGVPSPKVPKVAAEDKDVVKVENEPTETKEKVEKKTTKKTTAKKTTRKKKAVEIVE
jgi:hypothetical protein